MEKKARFFSGSLAELDDGGGKIFLSPSSGSCKPLLARCAWSSEGDAIDCLSRRREINCEKKKTQRSNANLFLSFFPPERF